jgi:nicotinate-nucleotide pyrophosphorylase (carboxylating)
MNTANKQLVNKLITLALAEDIGDGDHTTLCCIPETANGKMQLLIKENGILAGIQTAQKIFHRFDNKLVVKVILEDGSKVTSGDVAFTVEGSYRSLLQTERTVLNVMQRMSGIATVTKRFVDMVKDTNAIILDTRKTTPGMRLLEKEAVNIGGGQNHRTGLYDMILLKDNHVDIAGGIKAAITGARKYLKENNKSLPIEVEVRNFSELDEALLTGGINRILLDNFTIENTAKAVAIVNSQYPLESSGNITEQNVKDYAKTGVDYISVGALTHSVKSLDMSLKYT